MTTEEAADAIIADLQTHGWHQGGAYDHHGSRCIMYSLTETIREPEPFCALAGALFAHSLAAGFGTTAAWNDDPHTTYEDVILALKQAGRP